MVVYNKNLNSNEKNTRKIIINPVKEKLTTNKYKEELGLIIDAKLIARPQ